MTTHPNTKPQTRPRRIGGNYATGHGGAIANQTGGNVYQNIFWYNSAQFDGGAVYNVGAGVVRFQSNIIIGNRAGINGGGISNITEPATGNVQFRSNIIARNRANGIAGGVYKSKARCIGNTIVDNRSTNPPHGLDDRMQFQLNNIIWGNRNLGGTVQTFSGAQVNDVSFNLDLHLENCAVQEVNAPSGQNNIGLWSESDPVLSDTNIGFISPSLIPQSGNGPTYNWGEYLHLESTSPLVDAGNSGSDVNPNPPPEDTTNYAARAFRDVDDNVGPLGDLIDNGAGQLVYRRDIGADEVPTPGGGDPELSIQWWERF